MLLGLMRRFCRFSSEESLPWTGWGCRTVCAFRAPILAGLPFLVRCGVWSANVLFGSLHLCSEVKRPVLLFPRIALGRTESQIPSGSQEPGRAARWHVPLRRPVKLTEPCRQACISGDDLW